MSSWLSSVLGSKTTREASSLTDSNYSSTGGYKYNIVPGGCFSFTNENSLTQLDFGDESYDVSELEQMKSNLENEKSTAEGELSEINAGTSEELSELKGEADAAYQKYQDSLNQDASDNPELAELQSQEQTNKEEIETNAADIATKEGDIASKNNEISGKQTEIDGLSSELSTLQSQLASIPADSTEEGSEEANAALQAQREQIQTLINLKQQELNVANAELEALNDELQTLNDELNDLNTKKGELESTQTELQNEIKELSSEQTQQYQEDYNKAQEAYEKAQERAQSTKQTKIDDLQNQINQVEEQIHAAKNENYKNGDYSFDMSEAVDTFKKVNEMAGVSTETINAVSQAFSEIGINEGNTDNAGDVLKYGGAAGDAWCASFVSWLYGDGQGNDNSDTFGYEVAVRQIRGDAQNAGYYSAANSYEPVAGDIMIQENNASHTGMIVKTDENYIYTIEGNAGDAVRAKKYAKDGTAVNRISGYVRMNEWNGSSSTPINVDAIPNSAYEDADKDLNQSTL